MAAKNTLQFFLGPLLKKFFQDMGRSPNNLEMILLRQKAGQLFKDSNKIIPFKQKRSFAEEIEAMKKSGDIVDPNNLKKNDNVLTREMFRDSNLNKPTIEGQMDKINAASNRIKQIQKEQADMYKPKTDAEIKAKYDKQNKESIQKFKDKMKKDKPEDKADGGRIGFRVGKFVLDKVIANLLKDKNKIKQAADDIFPTGDYKMDAEMAADALVENNPAVFKNLLREDLPDEVSLEIYEAVLKPIMSNMAKMRELRKASRPEKTLESMKKGEGIDMSNPDIADEFARFMKETDPQGSKTIEQTVELSNFDPKKTKGNAEGGRIGFDEAGIVDPGLAEDKAFKAMMKSFEDYKKNGGKYGLQDWLKIGTGGYRQEQFRAEGGRIGFSTGKGILSILKNLFVKPSGDDLKNFLSKRKFMKDIVGNTEKNKRAREFQKLKEAMEEARENPGFEFPSGIELKTEIEKKILPILLKDRKLNADGGRIGFYTGGIADVEPRLDDIGHGSDSLMARTRLVSPDGQATTSTGLNYLLAEDNDNIRVPFSTGKLAGGIDSAIEENINLEEEIEENEMIKKFLEAKDKKMQLEQDLLDSPEGVLMDPPFYEQMPKGGATIVPNMSHPDRYSDFNVPYIVFDDGTIFYPNPSGGGGEFIDRKTGETVDGPSPNAKPVNTKTAEAAEGGRIGFKVGGDAGRRAFLKLLATLGGGIAGIKSGILGLGEKSVGKKAITETVKQSAGSGTPPPYFFKLVEKIKTMGDDVTEKAATKEREVVTEYKNFRLTEDVVTGEKTIQRLKTDDGSFQYYDETLAEETYMNYKPGAGQADEGTKGIPADEYIEDTSYLRTSGPQKGEIYDTVDGVPDDILEEIGEKKVISEKADGGRIDFSGGGLANVLARLNIKGSSRRFLEKAFGKERFQNLIENDPEMHRGLLEVVEMFRNRDKEGLKMYMQKFLPHMDDAQIEEFIIGSTPDIEGLTGQLIRLGSGRDYAGKIEMMKKADNIRKLENFDIKNVTKNAEGGRIEMKGGGDALKALIRYYANKKGVKGSTFLKDINPKVLPEGIENIMGPGHLKALQKNQTDYVESLLNIIKSDKKFLNNLQANADEAIAQAPIGMKDFAKEITESIKRDAMKGSRFDRMKVYDKIDIDDAIVDVEQMIKNRRVKESDGRALNASGGLQTMLGE